MDMQIAFHDEGEITVVTLSGKLLMGEATESLRNLFHERLDSGRLLFIFDLVSLRYTDSAGIGEIVSCHLHAQERGGCIRIVNRPPADGERRWVGGLVPLPIAQHETMEAALGSFKT